MDAVSRFKTQAVVGGLSRQAGTSVVGQVLPTQNNVGGFLARYQNAGPAIFASAEKITLFAAWMLVVLIWLGSLLFQPSTRNATDRIALALIGLSVLVLPFALLQSSYLVLGRCIFPFLLLTDFLGSRDSVRGPTVPCALILLNLLVLLPGTAMSVVQRFETKPTYLAERKQVQTLARYLGTNERSKEGVTLVPVTHYFVYKDSVDNLFNQEYLSPQHDLSKIVAVVNCPVSTSYLDAAKRPLPPLLAKESWRVLDSLNDPQTVSLFGKRLMQKNWTWGCVVYVRAK